jgi:hypothetical protein
MPSKMSQSDSVKDSSAQQQQQQQQPHEVGNAGTGEGAASALERMRNQERANAEGGREGRSGGNGH